MGDRGHDSAGGEHVPSMNTNDHNMNGSFLTGTVSPDIYMTASPASTDMGPISGMGSAQKAMPIVQDPAQMSQE